MDQPSSPRRRTRAVVGAAFAAGLGVTSLFVATSIALTGDGAAANDEAVETAEERYDLGPRAHRRAWLGDVSDYVEQESARRYSVAVYGNLANWNAVGQYADALAAQAAESAAYSGGTGSHLDAIRQCESGGDYSAVSSSGTYRGAYQFDYATWQGVGGSGDPAAASPAEQDMRAQMLYEQSGSSPWPVCGS